MEVVVGNNSSSHKRASSSGSHSSSEERHVSQRQSTHSTSETINNDTTNNNNNNLNNHIVTIYTVVDNKMVATNTTVDNSQATNNFSGELTHAKSKLKKIEHEPRLQSNYPVGPVIYRNNVESLYITANMNIVDSEDSQQTGEFAKALIKAKRNLKNSRHRDININNNPPVLVFNEPNHETPQQANDKEQTSDLAINLRLAKSNLKTTPGAKIQTGLIKDVQTEKALPSLPTARKCKAEPLPTLYKLTFDWILKNAKQVKQALPKKIGDKGFYMDSFYKISLELLQSGGIIPNMNEKNRNNYKKLLDKLKTKKHEEKGYASAINEFRNREQEYIETIIQLESEIARISPQVHPSSDEYKTKIQDILKRNRK